jgi:hypothetical protein
MESNLLATRRKHQHTISALTRAYTEASRRDRSLIETMRAQCTRLHRELVRLAVPSTHGKKAQQAALQLLNVQLLAALQREANLKAQLVVARAKGLKDRRVASELEVKVEQKPETNQDDPDKSSELSSATTTTTVVKAR